MWGSMLSVLAIVPVGAGVLELSGKGCAFAPSERGAPDIYVRGSLHDYTPPVSQPIS